MTDNTSDASVDADSDELAIVRNYNTSNPEFAFVCGGLRRVAVNPHDKRARTQLLRHGVRYFSKMQAMVYVVAAACKPDVFFDIGVNYGECLFSLPLNSDVRAYGFEANPALLPLIKRSIRYNDDLKRVQVFQKAMSETAGEQIPFFVNNAWSGKSTAVTPSRQRSDIEKISVETTTLDQELLKLDTWSTALIKIDVEGFEPKVLRGGKSIFDGNKNIAILLEFDSNFIQQSGESVSEFFDFLQANFAIFAVLRRSISKMTSLEDLQKLDTRRESIHFDLLLVNSQDESWSQNLIDQLTSRPLVEAVSEAWGLPRKKQA